MLIPLSYIKLEETLVPRHNTNGTLLQDWELKSSMKEFCLILRGIIFAYLVCVAQNVTNASCLFFHKVQWTIRGSASSAQWVCSNSIKRRILAVGRHIFETIVVTMEPSWNAVVVKSCRQCPTGTRTRPATRYFLRYPTRPDSILRIFG